MKSFGFVLLLVLVKSSSEWYAKEFRNSSQASSEGCESVDVNLGKMHLGEFRDLEDCVQAVCGDTGILYLGCKEVEESGNCTVIQGNNTMPYPECCDACKEATN
ncbi:hypothetical protein FQR65_LT06704 [Abscondita terminalis]|nr:hypothetical protein FQR65_LT06704 [Abscondita terminalis]